MQDPDMLHATLFHASTHMDPMPASTAGINEEVLSLIQTASNTCPMQAILERVVITRSGTVVACWQVLPGSIDPSELRRRLKLALPDASRKQVVTDHAILHTTLARIGVPLEGDWSPTESAHALWMATGAMTADLCGLTTTFDLLW